MQYGHFFQLYEVDSRERAQKEAEIYDVGWEIDKNALTTGQRVQILEQIVC